MRHAETTTASALSRWRVDGEVWTTTGPVDAGETIEPGAVRPISSPPTWYSVGAVATDPRGLRTRIELDTGEIVVEALAHRHRVDARRTHPGGWLTISIGRRVTSSPSVISSTSITRSTVDGSPPTRFVVMASDADLGVAVPADVVGDVVRASGQAGVVPVLSG